MTYTVQAGDTLWAIARKYNCSITEIVAANSDRIKNPNRIHAGWQLKIPQSGAPITGGTPDAVLPEKADDLNSLNSFDFSNPRNRRTHFDCAEI